jgi:cytochrome P450
MKIIIVFVATTKPSVFAYSTECQLDGVTMMANVRPYDEIPLVQVPANYPEGLVEFISNAYEQYGPVFRIKPYDIERVILVGPEANRFIMSSDRLKFSHKIGWGEAFGVVQMFGDGLLTQDGEKHDRERRMMNPAFTIQYMDRYLPIMNRVVREHVEDWKKRGVIEISDEARKITFAVAAETLTGLQPGREINEFRMLYFGLLMATGNTPEEWEAQIAPIKARLNELLSVKIEERRRNPTNDILGMMIQARDEQGNVLSDEQLIAHINILLVAGHETSTSLLAWLLYLLIEHPDYRQRVLDEQAALLGTDEDSTLEHIKKMKVLDNALSEAERLYPPVAHGPRGVLEAFDFGGYHIPAGKHVFYSITASHLISSIFQDPLKFDPDRFAPPREEDKKVPYALVGFGGGPRICIGINFAQVELKAVASHILRQTSLELIPGQRIEQIYYGPTGSPINGIHLKVSEPQSTQAAGHLVQPRG